MIDRKTREKIVELWSAGETKASIKSKVKVSLPTIRKILREEGCDNSNEKKINKDIDTSPGSEFEGRLRNLETLVNDRETSNDTRTNGLIVHEFVLNFTKVMPYSMIRDDIWRGCAQGVSPLTYPEHLLTVLDVEAVKAIESSLSKRRLGGRHYSVRLVQNSEGICSLDIHDLKP